MRTLVVLACLALPLPAGAQQFIAWLTGYQEVPSVSTPADGIFQARVTNQGHGFDYVLQVDDIAGTVQQAHIHFAQWAVNGPIVVWLCGTTTNPGPAGTQTCPQSGTLRGTIRAADVLAAPATQQLAAGEIQEVIRAMRAGAAYVNVHSSVSPGGEIRGQIHPW
jgi:hypothetical protein